MSKISENPQMILKIVFVGDSGVGKTSLIQREAENHFTQEHLATIGVDFRIKTYQVGKISVKAQLWDTAGQERFRSIQKPYYRSTLLSI
jgi:small GTP-binding protein